MDLQVGLAWAWRVWSLVCRLQGVGPYKKWKTKATAKPWHPYPNLELETLHPKIGETPKVQGFWGEVH